MVRDSEVPYVQQLDWILENRRVWVMSGNGQDGGAGCEVSAVGGSRKREMEGKDGPSGRRVKTSQEFGMGKDDTEMKG